MVPYKNYTVTSLQDNSEMAHDNWGSSRTVYGAVNGQKSTEITLDS